MLVCFLYIYVIFVQINVIFFSTKKNQEPVMQRDRELDRLSSVKFLKNATIFLCWNIMITRWYHAALDSVESKIYKPDQLKIKRKLLEYMSCYI